MAKDFEKLIEDSFVYSIRKKGSLKEYIPFWNLKLSFKEYECLKSHLKYHISSKKEYSSLDFAVYISEWWRRECCNKNYTENISQSLDLNDNGIIRNAVGGISEIDTFCDIYRANVYQRKLDSIMFQGGLPLKWIVENNTSSNYWKKRLAGVRFIQDGDSSSNNSYIVAGKSVELAEFCEAVKDAYDRGSRDDMPFYCEDDDMYNKIIMIINRHRNENPFSISWEVRVDEIDPQINVKYNIKVDEKLSTEFIRTHFNDCRPKVQVYIDNTLIKTFEYNNNGRLIGKREFCGDYIDATLIEFRNASGEEKEIFVSDSLTLLSEPNFVFREDENSSVYHLGKRMKEGCSRCIIPSVWNIVEDTNKTAEDYKEYLYSGSSVRIIDLSAKREITIKNEETEKECKLNLAQITIKTICVASPNYTSNFIEPIFNISNYNDFKLVDDEGSVYRVKKDDRMLYRTINGKFGDKIPQGRIFATVEREGENILPTTSLINLSNLPKVDVRYSSASECRVKFEWEDGKIEPDKSKLRNCSLLENGEWKIEKDDNDPVGVIPLLCKPNDNDSPVFTLHMNAPYNELIVYKPMIGNESIRLSDNKNKIPYCELQSYRISGVNRVKIKKVYPNKDEGRYIYIKGSCSLGYIIEKLYDVKKNMDTTLDDINKANINICITAGEQSINIIIQEYPYEIWVNDVDNNAKEIVVGKHKPNTTLYLLPFEDPESKKEINVKDGSCLIPPELIENRFLICCKQGYSVFPKKYDPNNDTIGGIKSNIDILATALQESDSLSSEDWIRIKKWISLCKEGVIHAQNIWDLICVSKDFSLLEKTAYILWANIKDYEEDNLIHFMLQLQEQLAFEWYWLPFNDNSFISKDVTLFENACNNHYLEKDEYCKFLEQWTSFVTKLKIRSRGADDEIIEENFDAPLLTDDHRNIFGYNQKVDARTNVPQYLRDNINHINNVLSQDYKIRRAIIYYHKYDTGFFNAIFNGANN